MSDLLDVITVGVAVWLLLAFLRIIYQIALGFLYINPNKPLKSKRPLVSVIVPAWNEEVGISKTINSVMDSGYYDLEIIIVNDGSTDRTQNTAEQTINSYPKRHQSKIKLINQRNAGKASALNTGIAHARGEFILTLDADSYLAPDSIGLLVNALEQSDYGVAIGEVVVGNTRQLLGMAQHYEYLIGFHFKRSQHVTNSSYIFPGALTMFRSEILTRVGGFESYSSTEDLDMSMKIKAAGGRVAYVDGAICITEGAVSISGLISQRTRWRHGYIECVLKRKEFTLSLSKGKYLSLVELPISILSVLEIIFLPFLIAFIVVYSLSISNIQVLIVSYFILPLFVVLLAEIRNYKKPPLKYVFIMPVLATLINFIEYVALHKALYRTIVRKKTLWTKWQRQGL